VKSTFSADGRFLDVSIIALDPPFAGVPKPAIAKNEK
jgi:hypothetical protein